LALTFHGGAVEADEVAVEHEQRHETDAHQNRNTEQTHVDNVSVCHVVAAKFLSHDDNSLTTAY